MDTILFKYEGFGLDYLVYDICRNKENLSSRCARLIFNKNCGAAAQGILTGSVMKDGEMEVRMLRPDGSEEPAGSDCRKVYNKYLKDVGYGNGTGSGRTGSCTDTLSFVSDQNADIRMIGKVYVSEEQLSGNRI